MRTQISEGYFMETSEEEGRIHYYLFEELNDEPGHCRCVLDGLVDTKKNAIHLCRLWLKTRFQKEENHAEVV